MKRRILAIVAGVVACGDDRALVGDAAPGPHDASRDAPADAAPDAFVEPGLLLEFAFEDAATVVTDRSGRGKHGTLSDVSAWTASGRSNRGLALTGGNPATRFVTLADGVLTGTAEFTITVWIKANTTLPWVRIYDIGNGKADPENRFMYLTLNGFTGVVNDGIHAASYGGSPSNESILATSTQLPTGVWKHIALTGSGGERTLYIDGFPASHVTGGPVVAPSEMEPIAPNSWLGKSRFPDPGLDATLDDFRIYGKLLSATQIADLAWPQRDYSYWRFDERSGATAKDSSDAAIPTVLANGPTWTAGKQGGAIDLAGGAAGATGPQVVLATSPLASCTTQLTIAAWIKLRTLTPWSRVFDFGTGLVSFIYLAPTDGTGMHFAMVSAAGVFDMVTATPPIAADSAWHHVAVTVDPAGLVTLYADGAAVKTQTSATVKPSDFAATTENWLGRSRFPDPYLDGAIDELRISCRAYTADEIKNLSRP
jgi:hypothetical protein